MIIYPEYMEIEGKKGSKKSVENLDLAPDERFQITFLFKLLVNM